MLVLKLNFTNVSIRDTNMSPEKRRRTPEEVKKDFLLKRLDLNQLLALVDEPSFEKYKGDIIEKLQPVDNYIGAKDFIKVHSSKKCKITTTDTGYSIRVGGVNLDIGEWSDSVPAKKYSCKKHKVTSVEFIDYGGIHEGPFNERYKI
jgi:hypothetical protein